MDDSRSHQHSAPVPPTGEVVRLDPVCGMIVPLDGPHRLEHGGSTYLFCNAGCLERFRADPAAFLEPATPAEHVDPVCGMSVAADSPHRLEHEGTTYRFCCAGCVDRFRADPARYLEEREPEAPDPGGSTPARCTPRWCRSAPATAPSAAWRWNPRGFRRRTRAPIRSWWISRAASGSARF